LDFNPTISIEVLALDDAFLAEHTIIQIFNFNILLYFIELKDLPGAGVYNLKLLLLCEMLEFPLVYRDLWNKLVVSN